MVETMMKPHDWIVIFISILVVYSVAASSKADGKCADITASLIESFKLDIPDECSKVAVGGVVCTKAMVCSQVGLGYIKSSYAGLRAISVVASDAHMECGGDFEYSFGNIRGGVAAEVKINSISSTPVLSKQPDGSIYPKGLNVSSCALSGVNIDLSFSGGIASRILNIIAPEVEGRIRKALTDSFCPGVSELISTKGTRFITGNVNPALQNIIVEGTPDEDGSTLSSKYVDWRSSIVDGLRRVLFDDWTALWLGCVSGDNNGNDIDIDVSRNYLPVGALIRYLMHGERQVLWNVSASNQLIFPSVMNIAADPLLGANVSLRVEAVSIGGLEGIRAQNLLQPVPNSRVALLNSFTAPSFTINTTMTIFDTITVSGAKSRMSEILLLRVNITNPSVDVELAVGVDEKRLNALRVERLTNPRYWLSTADFLNITSLSLSLNNSVVAAEIESISSPDCVDIESSDSQFLGVADAVMKMLSTDYNVLVDQLLVALLQGIVRHEINANLAALLATSKAMVITDMGVGVDMTMEELKFKEGSRSSDRSLYKQYYAGGDGNGDFIDWEEFEPLIELRCFLDNFLSLEDVNHILQCLPPMPTPHLFSALTTKPGFHKSSSGAAVDLSKTPVKVSGIGSLYDLSLLGPAHGRGRSHDLSTVIGIGACDSRGIGECEPFKIEVVLSGNSSTYYSVVFSLTDTHLVLTSLVELSLSSFRGLKFKDLFHPACLLPLFHNISVDSLGFGLGSAIVTIYLHEGEERNGTVIRVSDTVTEFMSLVCSPEGIYQINYLLNQWMGTTESSCPTYSPNASPEATSSDGNSMGTLSVEVMLALVVLMSVIGTVLAFRAYFKSLYPPYDRNKQLARPPAIRSVEPWLSAPLSHSDSNPIPIPRRTQDGSREQKSVWRLGSSYVSANSNGVSSLWIMLSVSLAIIGNMMLFLCSNFSTNAVGVLLTLHWESYKTSPENVFSFGLVTTVCAMWEAEVYAIALAVAILSGVWPYAKLLTLLVCWFSLTTSCDYAQCSGVLRALEALGKWSLVDFYVMVLMMCAFSFETSFGNLRTTLHVQPNFGFYSFLVATMLSHCLSHVVSAFSKRALGKGGTQPDSIRAPSGSLSMSSVLAQAALSPIVHRSSFHGQDPAVAGSYSLLEGEGRGEDGGLGLEVTANFQRKVVEVGEPDPNADHTLQTGGTSVDRSIASVTTQSTRIVGRSGLGLMEFTRMIEVVAVIALVAVTVLVTLGIVLPAFEFKFQGVAGNYLSLSRTKSRIMDSTFIGDSAFASASASRVFTMLDVARDIPTSSGLPNGDMGIIFMQLCFAAFCVVVPAALLIVVSAIWFLKVRHATLTSLTFWLEILSAWNALDVYCLSILLTLLQVGQFTDFMVGPRNADGCKPLANRSSEGMVASSKCFVVVATLRSGFVWLLMGSVLLQVVVSITLFTGKRVLLAIQNSSTAKLESTTSLSEAVAAQRADVNDTSDNCP